jgi:hypothetical protein
MRVLTPRARHSWEVSRAHVGWRPTLGGPGSRNGSRRLRTDPRNRLLHRVRPSVESHNARPARES